jgi:Zn-dependent peptidase ImmA (M78 family)
MSADARQVFTLMHELAHVLLHRKSYIDDTDDLYSYQGREREANAFAGRLLVPPTALNKIDDETRPGDVSEFDAWLRPFTRRLGVSTEVILRRLLDSNRLPQNAYDGYRSWRATQPAPSESSGNRQYRHREPKHIFGDTFVSVVFDALHAKEITLAKASTFLDNLRISDVHRLEDFYAGL